MKYVFDSSSIFRAVLENKVDLLVDGYTDEIARYELGNIIWKKRVLKKELDEDEYSRLSRLIYRVFNLLSILNIHGSELDVTEIAVKYELTFYDATYVCHSKNMELPLVTEDEKLKHKIKDIIKVISLNEI